MVKREQVEKEKRDGEKERGRRSVCRTGSFLPNSIAATRWSMVVGETTKSQELRPRAPDFLPIERLSHLVPRFNRFSIFSDGKPSTGSKLYFSSRKSCQNFCQSAFEVLRKYTSIKSGDRKRLILLVKNKNLKILRRRILWRKLSRRD